ncbi:Phosphotransferase enzyme family [Aspergillus sclerotialis]|uniref:Phosphotransferase enzyme family n=1 Tax=Aspergillus sclerotialis TaxID=2070753 RepID=A0A3A2ZIP5_9EURO|nr:Phosphotransferase enzyme family [Aspergillus sclerotialis]
MRDITGNFIGGLDESPCRDGIFEAGFGDYTRYNYGAYLSEETFNEGIVQALRDRLSPKTLAGENDTESTFFNSEYILYQTVRGLKGHKIVFTHGDLHPSNIIVKDDGTVVLLDWGLSGFWPEYWEFYRAMFSPGWRASWDRMVEMFIPPYYVEYSVIKRVFGVVWN